MGESPTKDEGEVVVTGPLPLHRKNKGNRCNSEKEGRKISGDRTWVSTVGSVERRVATISSSSGGPVRGEGGSDRGVKKRTEVRTTTVTGVEVFLLGRL